MDIKVLRYFLAVAREENMTRAAEKFLEEISEKLQG